MTSKSDPKLPMIPGLNSFRDYSKKSHAKSHLIEGTGVVVTMSCSAATGTGPAKPERAHRPSAMDYIVDEEGAPVYTVAEDCAFQLRETVLRFYAYFVEKVPDGIGDRVSERIHRCIILLYAADDTIELIEEVQANSGLPQGK